MAIVNKFNVNKQQVTLDADIIENMSANDVSYNSSLQYGVNTVGNKLSELEYDVTANNDGATFASLSALLSDKNLSTLIPTSVRHGGMSIRFVQSSDNEYVQFRYMGTATTNTDFANVSNWQGVDDVPTAGSDNLVKSGGVAGYVSVSQNSQTGETTINVDRISVDVANSDSTPKIENSNADFAITDENNEAIVVFNGGEIKTKNFDSRNLKSEDTNDTNIDFAVSDSNNNLIVEFSDGHIKTKNFDSRNLKVKHFGTFSIIGDSYSTFKEYSKPDTNAQWYPTDDSTCQGYNSENDVTKIEETWFFLFANDYKCALIQNDSYSGSTICYDGYKPGHDSGATQTSFCKRIERVTMPCELLLIFGGTNDSWAGSSIGEYKYSNWTEEDKEYFRPALAYLVDYIKKHHIGTQILFVLNNGLSSDINTSVETICEHYKIPLLKLSNITKKDSHPDTHGMIEISEQIKNFLKTI